MCSPKYADSILCRELSSLKGVSLCIWSSCADRKEFSDKEERKYFWWCLFSHHKTPLWERERERGGEKESSEHVLSWSDCMCRGGYWYKILNTSGMYAPYGRIKYWFFDPQSPTEVMLRFGRLIILKAGLNIFFFFIFCWLTRHFLLVREPLDREHIP